MTADNTDRLGLNRRRFIGATGAGLFATGFGGSASATLRGGDGDGGNGGGDGGDGGTDRDPDAGITITLVTGETVHVYGEGDDRELVVDGDEPGSFHLLEFDGDTFLVPTDADLDVYSEELFNVDFLIEQGFTDAETDAVPVVVSLAEGLETARDGPGIRAADGFVPRRELESIGAVAGDVTKDRAAAASASVLESGAVDRVHLDAKYEEVLHETPDAIEATDARDQFDVDGSGVSVAILDTGIDTDHPDFGDRIVHREDFSGDGPGDRRGHGTHVAGIAAGDGSESDGEYVGVAPGADLFDVKVLGDDGSGSLSGIVAGIEHAVAEGADVINMSLGGTVQDDDPLEAAVDEAAADGVTVVVSAGNDGGYESITSPGQAAGALTVGASDPTDRFYDHDVADISSGGPTPIDYRVKPEVVAPGVYVEAAGSSEADEAPYASKSGTSMSAPHVAGVVALLLEHDGDHGPESVRDRLLSTATELDDGDVFRQGGGQVDAAAALGSDLQIHDAVGNFGVFGEPTTDAWTVAVENVGDETIELDVAASLVNLHEGEPRDDNVSVSAEAVTVEPDETVPVDVEIDTTDSRGFNSGILTFEREDGTTHRAVFGFARGLAVSVEKLPHEENDSVAGDQLWVWSHDGEYSNSVSSAFDADGKYRLFLLHEGGEFTFWSPGKLTPEDPEEDGEPTFTVESVTIDEDNREFTIDENATVPRELGTDAVDDHTPFRTREFRPGLHARPETGTNSYRRSMIGDFGFTTSHVSPIDEDDVTNVSTQYLLTPRELTGEYNLDSPAVYHLMYTDESVPEGGQILEIDPDELATEEVTYYRNYEGQFYGAAPTVSPADQLRFPTTFATGFTADVGDERFEQTWYLTDEGSYDGTWFDGGSRDDGDWRVSRTRNLVPEAGRTYRADFNREPLQGYIPEWDVDEDGNLDYAVNWYGDQAEHKWTMYEWYHDHPNFHTVWVDGSEAYHDDGIGSSNSVSGSNLMGSHLEILAEGNTMYPPRGISTEARYNVTLEPDTANRPPEVESILIAGLDRYNEVPAGQLIAFVDVDERAGGVDDFEAYYAERGVADESPFDDPSGWTPAEVVYEDDGRYGVRVDAAGYDGIDLAFGGVDADGNSVETTTFDAVTVSEGAAVTAPADVRPDEIDVGSNQTVPVVIEPTDDLDPHEIDVDTLRFGEPQAVHAGGGATPHNAQELGNGSLQVHFRANETGYEESGSPAAAQLVGELEDGTVLSSATLVDVTGD